MPIFLSLRLVMHHIKYKHSQYGSYFVFLL